jgi:predicted phage tail protein
MSDIIIDILKEELSNAKERKILYKKKAKSRFAKSHLRKKKVGNSIYYYLQWREGNNIKSEYLGKLLPEEVEKYQMFIDDAKKEKEILKKLDRRIKFIEKSLKNEAIVK